MTEYSTARIGVILLNWNGFDDTAECLRSLRESIRKPDEILIYDNGSSDGSADRLAAEFGEITLVRDQENRGFCEGNNRATSRLLANGMDLIWVLNNDTRVEPDCLERLVRTLDSDRGLGAVSAKIWFMDDRKPICYAGGTFRSLDFKPRFPGLREEDAGQFDQAGDTEILSGCCMLIRSEVIRRIGLFNRMFFAYLEDVDWCLRAGEEGIRLGYVPDAGLWHKMYGSTNRRGQSGIPKSTPRVEALLCRNWVLLTRLHTRPWSVQRSRVWLLGLLFRLLPRELCLLLLPGRHLAGRAGIAGLWRGFRLPLDAGDCRVDEVDDRREKTE